MSILVLPYVFSTGATIIASQHNTNNATIFNDYNGSIVDANISPTAGIEYTKLALGGSIKTSDLISSFTLSVANGGTGSTASANGANGVVTLNGSSQLPAVSGVNLTNIGNSNVTGILGAWSSITPNQTNTATTDGFLIMSGQATTNYGELIINTPVATQRCYTELSSGMSGMACCFVIKGDTYSANATNITGGTYYFLPIGS